jgi:hypothetical protein
MKKDIAIVIDELIGAMDNSMVGQWDSELGQWKTCQTKWGRVGKIMLDESGNRWMTTGIETNQWLTAVPMDDPMLTLNDVTKLFLAVPYPITGTKISANREWTIANPDVMQKTPLIWLLEIIRLTEFGRDASLEFESDLRLFFLDETNVAQFYTMDARQNVVQPMDQMIDEFVATINRDKRFKRVLDTQRITFARFGVEKDNGMFQNILDANLSGVELRINLKKFKENCINC